MTAVFVSHGWSTIRWSMAKAVEKATGDGYDVKNGLKGIGLTNQRETTLVWSKSTGLSLHNAIVWMDGCSYKFYLQKIGERVIRRGGRTHFVDSCGLPISTYFSAPEAALVDRKC